MSENVVLYLLQVIATGYQLITFSQGLFFLHFVYYYEIYFKSNIYYAE